MIIGNGIDIVKNDRIGKLVKKYEDNFLNKIYTKAEIEYCKRKKNEISSLAARFAAKEALLKALGTGMRNNSWQDIEILNDDLGKPQVKLYGKTKIQADNKKVHSIFLSISHEKEYSVAQVILEGV